MDIKTGGKELRKDMNREEAGRAEKRWKEGAPFVFWSQSQRDFPHPWQHSLGAGRPALPPAGSILVVLPPLPHLPAPCADKTEKGRQELEEGGTRGGVVHDRTKGQSQAQVSGS